MQQTVRETTTTSNANVNSDGTPPAETQSVSNEVYTTERVIYFVLGAVEVLLAFRLLLKLTGANPSTGFVEFIYGLSRIFVTPFTGIFSSAYTQGAETTAVLEPSTIVAMIVYAVLAWGAVSLIGIAAKKG